ncbi:hypothetical protein P23_0892 [Acinetobacter calcoaceticus]|nr:hypothetical protein P23_0892 [Acinetobacter calcoaceticus]
MLFYPDIDVQHHLTIEEWFYPTNILVQSFFFFAVAKVLHRNPFFNSLLYSFPDL